MPHTCVPSLDRVAFVLEAFRTKHLGGKKKMIFNEREITRKPFIKHYKHSIHKHICKKKHNTRVLGKENKALQHDRGDLNSSAVNERMI